MFGGLSPESGTTVPVRTAGWTGDPRSAQPAMRAARSLPTSAVDRTRSASRARRCRRRRPSRRAPRPPSRPRCSSSRATDSTVAVGSALPWPAMSGRGAVHRLEHARRGAVRVDVGRRGQADAARDRRGEVREDVAEQVVGDDHVEPRRVGDQEDRRRVHVQVVDRHVGELGVHGLDRAAPQVAGVHQHVVLVHERELLARAGRGAGERVAHHALDAERRVHADLVGHLVRRAHADARRRCRRTDPRCPRGRPRSRSRPGCRAARRRPGTGGSGAGSRSGRARSAA